MGTVRGVIYDLDGTLVDSAPDIAAAVNFALAKRGLAQLPVADVARMVGTGGHNVCRLALRKLGIDVDVEVAEVEATYQDFFAYYKEHPVVATKAYPGTREGLAALREAGFVQGICTNKTAAVTKLVIEQLGLAEYFGSVVGADATPSHKPDPAHLLHVARELGIDASQVAYVGDTKIDLRTAKAAGVRYFAVAWSNPDAHEEGFSTALASVADLPALLAG